MKDYFTFEDIREINIRGSNEEDKKRDEWFDFSTLTDIATCPTYGIIRHGYGKVPKKGAKSQALEAGQASHDVYAASRLLQVLDQGHASMFLIWGEKLFGEARFEKMKQYLDNEDKRLRRMQFCLEALYTSGFTDDDKDKKRTMGNIEESCIAYLDRYEYEKYPVWVDEEAGKCGVEVPVDMTIEFVHEDGMIPVRIVGRVDGVHVDANDPERIILNENKTSARLSESWRTSFMMSHQLTIYAIALSDWVGKHIEDVHVYGMAIPLPRNYDSGGFVRVPERRSARDHYPSLLRWILHNVQIYNAGFETPLETIKNTHSCNRYFSTCMYMCICASNAEDRQQQFDDMDVEFWNPLAEETT